MNSLCQYHGERMDKCVKKTWTLRVNVREYSFSFNVQVIDSHLLQKLSIAFFIYMVPVCILNNVQQNVHFMHVSVFFLVVIHYCNFDLWNITLCNKGSVQHLNHCWVNSFFLTKVTYRYLMWNDRKQKCSKFDKDYVQKPSEICKLGIWKLLSCVGGTVKH